MPRQLRPELTPPPIARFYPADVVAFPETRPTA